VKLSHFGTLFIPLALGYCVFGSSSCIQIGPDSSDGGTDSGAATTHTLGDQCAAIATEYCSRTDDCELEQDPQSCQDEAVSSCCGSHCNDTSSIDETAVETCVDDLRSADCDTISAILGGDSTSLPASCQNVFGND